MIKRFAIGVISLLLTQLSADWLKERWAEWTQPRSVMTAGTGVTTTTGTIYSASGGGDEYYGGGGGAGGTIFLTTH